MLLNSQLKSILFFRAIQFFTIGISVRFDRYLSGFLLFAIGCANYLMKYTESCMYWKSLITITFKIYSVLILKKLHLISIRSVRFPYREKLN